MTDETRAALAAVRYGVVIFDLGSNFPLEDLDGGNAHWFHNGQQSELPFDQLLREQLIYEGRDGAWYLTSKGEAALLGGKD